VDDHAGRDGVEGFIVAAGIRRHIASAMMRLAEDRELNRRMGRGGVQKGAARNTWQDYGDRLFGGVIRPAEALRSSVQMRVAPATTDGREVLKDYATPPSFGTAPRGLGCRASALLPEVEVHVVSCVREKVNAPSKLAPSIFFHTCCPQNRNGCGRYQGCIRQCARSSRISGRMLSTARETEADCSISAVFSGHPNVLTIHGNMR